MNYIDFPFDSQQVTADAGEHVAIITRTRDRPILLERAFQSILSQTHQDWHVYVVNDGGCKAHVDELVAKYKGQFGDRSTILHNETSLGLARAVNTALRRVEGDFVILHDDDDTWDKEFLERTTTFLKKPENAQFIGAMTRFTYIHERIRGDVVEEFDRQIVPKWPATLKFFPLFYRNGIPPICYLIRMRAVRAIGLVNESLALLEDTDYLKRLLIYGDIAAIDEPLANYHLRPQPGADQLGNSVMVVTRDYKVFEGRYGNNLIRASLADNPTNIGLIYAISDLSAHLEQLQDKLDNLLTDNHLARRIATEVWFERQRWGLRPKLAKGAKAIIAKISRWASGASVR